MRHDLVLKADAVVGRLLVGFLNTCSHHPVLLAGFLSVLTVLIAVLWVEMFKASAPDPRPAGHHR